MPKFLNIVAASILAGLRIYGDKSQAFQAIAHLYDGALIWDGFRNENTKFYGYLGWVLAFVELTCFLVGKFS